MAIAHEGGRAAAGIRRGRRWDRSAILLARSASICATWPGDGSSCASTHLPQVAALAARHFTIAKDASVRPARTTVTALDGDQVVSELVRMLGAGAGDKAASQHARQLLKAA